MLFVCQLTYICGACLDWLLSRRHCSQNWSQMIVSVREKINIAIQDMPAVDDVASLLRGTCLYIQGAAKKTPVLKLQYLQKGLIVLYEILSDY